MCDELLVPLMCGATNVTMNSDKLGNVMIPVPKPALQDEAIESSIIAAKAATMIDAATALRDSSSDERIVKLAERVIRETEELLSTSKSKVTISDFLPT